MSAQTLCAAAWVSPASHRAMISIIRLRVAVSESRVRDGDVCCGPVQAVYGYSRVGRGQFIACHAAAAVVVRPGGDHPLRLHGASRSADETGDAVVADGGHEASFSVAGHRGASHRSPTPVGTATRSVRDGSRWGGGHCGGGRCTGRRLPASSIGDPARLTVGQAAGAGGKVPLAQRQEDALRCTEERTFCLVYRVKILRDCQDRTFFLKCPAPSSDPVAPRRNQGVWFASAAWVRPLVARSGTSLMNTVTTKAMRATGAAYRKMSPMPWP